MNNSNILSQKDKLKLLNYYLICKIIKIYIFIMETYKEIQQSEPTTQDTKRTNVIISNSIFHYCGTIYLKCDV